MGVLDGGKDRQMEKGSFGVNVGCPTVTKGNLWRSYSLREGWRRGSSYTTA